MIKDVLKTKLSVLTTNLIPDIYVAVSKDIKIPEKYEVLSFNDDEFFDKNFNKIYIVYLGKDYTSDKLINEFTRDL